MKFTFDTCSVDFGKRAILDFPWNSPVQSLCICMCVSLLGMY